MREGHGGSSAERRAQILDEEWGLICWLNGMGFPSAQAASGVKDLRSGAVLLQLAQVPTCDCQTISTPRLNPTPPFALCTFDPRHPSPDDIRRAELVCFAQGRSFAGGTSVATTAGSCEVDSTEVTLKNAHLSSLTCTSASASAKRQQSSRCTDVGTHTCT